MDFAKTQLDNGLRILTAPQHETKAMTLLFLVGTGSRFETKELGGMSHFLEHILFKGTEKYPSPQALAEVLDTIGANFNAYTSEEYTGFYVNAAAEHFPLALDVLHEMFYHPRYAKTDIEREKGVIVEEMNMYRDLPQRHVWDVLKRAIYGDTPIGRNIIGTEQTVRSFDKSTFESYQASWYTPDNLVVSVAGNPLKHKWLEELQARFASKRGTKARHFEAIEVRQSAPQVATEERKTDQTHLVLALPAVPETDKRLPIFSMLNTILGGSMSSRLFTEIREKRGLAYYVSSGLDTYHDTGFLALSAGVRNSHAKEAVTVMLTELDLLRRRPVTSTELRKAKEHFKGKMALRLEGSSEVASILAQQELYYGRQFQPEELIEETQAVTAKQIQDAAEEFFTRDGLTLAAVGPFKKTDFQPILEKAFS